MDLSFEYVDFLNSPEWIYFMAVKNRFCTGQNILIDGLEAGNCNFVWP